MAYTDYCNLMALLAYFLEGRRPRSDGMGSEVGTESPLKLMESPRANALRKSPQSGGGGGMPVFHCSLFRCQKYVVQQK